jgi:aspartate racemase
MESVRSLKRIGILGGSSDQATQDYYRRLNAEVKRRVGGNNTAELIINSMNFAFAADCVKHQRWQAVAEYLRERAQALVTAGADCVICVSNTLHTVSAQFTQDLTVPFLHIVDPTARAIVRQGFKRVALLGTQAVMSGTHARQKLLAEYAIETMVPVTTEQAYIDQVIFAELCQGVFTVAAKQQYLAIIHRLHQAGAQAVILGCTEIPLLIQSADAPGIPLLDMTELHVSAAVDFALSG